MEEEEKALSRKELRKQKLMEYLAGKGKLKQPNPKPYLRDDCQVKKPVTSTLKVVLGKENKAPVDRHERTKNQTLAAQSTKHPAARGALGVTSKVNVKASILTGRLNTNCPSATNGPAKPKLNHNPVLARTYTVVSSISNPNAPSHLKKLPNTGIPSSGRASSNAAHTAVTKSNSRFRNSSNATWSCPMKTVSVRMSLGPMVKTKTGLIPAVIQPRNSQNQNLIHASGAAADPTISTTTSVANKVQSSTLSSVSASQKSAMAQRKTLPTAAQNNNVRTRAGIKVQNHNKTSSKPLLGKQFQPSCKTQLSSGLKLTSTSSKCTAAPVKVKPDGRVGAAGQPTDRSTKQSHVGEGQKNGQTCKVASRTSSGLVSSCSSRVISGVTRAAVGELGGKTKTDGKKGHSSANAPPPQMGMKRISAPVMSQTVPRPSKTISYTGQATHTKTPKIPVKVPQTEGKKLTAAQEERMRKLQEWREAKGISYKRPPMPVRAQVKHTVVVPQPFWETMNEEDEAHSLICAVDRSLADCIKLLGEGCPADQVKEVLTRLPALSRKFAKYWICQARLMEQEGNLDVLPMFEEAVGVVLEPVDELRTVVFEILKKKDEIQAAAENEKEEDQISTSDNTSEIINNPMMTPKPVRALICGEKGNSSVVKYKITATPGGPPSQQKVPVRVNGQEVRFFTPVRRSVRIERSSLRYPASLQDHDLCVASYNDLIAEDDDERSEKQTGAEISPSANNAPMYVYRQNEALNDKVFVQLVYDEGV